MNCTQLNIKSIRYGIAIFLICLAGLLIINPVSADDVAGNFDQKEISTIFVNGKFFGPGKGVRDGDRIGLFPKRMGLMFLEIVKDNTINIKVIFFDRIKKTTEISVAIPEGNTIRSLLDKIHRPKGIKQRIMVNNKPCKENDLIVKNGDVISIFPKDSSI